MGYVHFLPAEFTAISATNYPPLPYDTGRNLPPSVSDPVLGHKPIFSPRHRTLRTFSTGRNLPPCVSDPSFRPKPRSCFCYLRLHGFSARRGRSRGYNIIATSPIRTRTVILASTFITALKLISLLFPYTWPILRTTRSTNKDTLNYQSRTALRY